MQIAIIVLSIVSAVLFIAVALLFIKLTRSGQDMLLHQKVDSIREEVTKNILHTQNTLFESQKSISEELNKLYKEIGTINSESVEILTLTKSFHDILKPTKKRSIVGESILAQLISDVFPKDVVFSQYGFRNGKKVDFLIKLPNGGVPVDAKFSLDAFKNFTDAQEPDQQRMRKVFVDSIKKRIDETAEYILPDEGTVDFALMYVPSEAVYYFVITETDTMEYANKRKVFIVGPNTFYVYLRTLFIGFEALKIERRAKFIYDSLKRLELDIVSLLREYGMLGGHLKNASAKYEEVKRKIERIEMTLTSFKAREEVDEDKDKSYAKSQTGED